MLLRVWPSFVCQSLYLRCVNHFQHRAAANTRNTLRRDIDGVLCGETLTECFHSESRSIGRVLGGFSGRLRGELDFPRRQ